MPAHTPREAVIAAANQARAAKADLIVTVGGGSITDGAKAVQLCLANDVSTVEGIDGIRVRGGEEPPLKPPVVRQISVPTTIAGGEFSHIAGVTDERTQVKQRLRHPLMMPRAAILDPWLSVHTPEWLFLSTGIRAVDHCVEGICAREAHPYSDAQAIKGLSMLTQGLQAGEGRPQRHRGAAGLPDRYLALDGAAVRRRADGREPRHRLCARAAAMACRTATPPA